MSNTPSPLLEARGLIVGYHRDRPLIAEADFSGHGGEVVALLGGNGAGKSTLLKTLSGELKPLAGSVTLSGRELQSLSGGRRARLLSIVATDATMAGALTVKQLVALGRHPYTGWTGILSATDRRVVEESMQAAGIAGKAMSAVATLSDGERQKAMIARALAQDTEVMLLDEPLSFLDPAARIEIFSLLRRLSAERGKLVVLSCHDVAMSLRMASTLWLLTTDRRLVCATPREAVEAGLIDKLFDSPNVKFSPEIGDFISNSHG